MKIAAYEADGRTSFGAVKDDGIVDLAGRIEGVRELDDLFEPERRAEAEEIVAGNSARHALQDVKLLIPVAPAARILCVGINYRDRNEEYKDNSDPSSYPGLFFRTHDSFVGHGMPLVRPLESDKLDYEGEIAIILGEGGRRIPREKALAHIGALTCLNEGTVRDWTRHAKFNVTQGKNFDRSGAIGPWMVTADEFDGYDDLHLQTRVNGEVRQEDTTARLIFDFSYLISYVSTFMTLHRGDVISTGTPTGAGVRFDPPRWLVPGDRVEVEATGIGVLCNEVIDEAA